MLNQRYLLEIYLGATDLKLNEDLSISVVVPFYNRSKFLKRLLDSIALQTLPADEVYIIDNGSSLEETLKAWNIITEHKLFNKCIFTSSIGKGNANFARNLGYELASTKYVAFLDSDDWWEKDHLLKSVYCLRNSDKVAVYSGAIIYTEKGIKINKSIDVNTFNNPFSLIISPEDYIAQTSSYIVNKDILEGTVTWSEELRRHQDFDYFASIFYKTSGWCYSPKPSVNIDWDHTSDINKNLDFNSLILFYKKWSDKIPHNLKRHYLIDTLYRAYRHKSNIKFKEFYRQELNNEGYMNNWKDRVHTSEIYIQFYINSVYLLDKLRLKKFVKKIIPSKF